MGKLRRRDWRGSLVLFSLVLLQGVVAVVDPLYAQIDGSAITPSNSPHDTTKVQPPDQQPAFRADASPVPAQKKAWLGTGLKNLTPEDAVRLRLPSAKGVLVTGVSSGSPADRAGISANDVIVAIDGTEVSEGRQVVEKVVAAGIDGHLILGLIRNGVPREVTVTLGEIGSEDVTSLVEQAGKAIAEERYADAEKLYQRAIPILEKMLDPTDPKLAAVVGNLGAVYYRQGRFAEAEPLAKRALEMSEKASPRNESEIARKLDNLALINERLGRYPEEVSLLKRLLVIEEKRSGPDHPEVGALFNRLRVVFLADKRADEALPYAARALAIAEKAFTPGHPNIAIAIDGMATLDIELGRFEEARALVDRLMRMADAAAYENGTAAVSALHHLALLHQEVRRFDDAERLFIHALKTFERIYGRDHPDGDANLAFNFGILRRMQGRQEEAEELFKRSRRVWVEKLPNNDPRVIKTFKAAGESSEEYFSISNKISALAEQNKWEEMAPLLKRKIAIIEKVFGPEDYLVADAAVYLGWSAYLQERYDDALSHFQKAMNIVERTKGPEHVNLVQPLRDIAQTLYAQGRISEAESYYQRALAIANKHDETAGPATVNVGIEAEQIPGPEAVPPSQSTAPPDNRVASIEDRFGAASSGYKADRPWIGASWRDLNIRDIMSRRAPEDFPGIAAVLDKIVEGGPAHAAGFRPGDVVSMVNGRVIAFGSDMAEAVSRVRPGEIMKLWVWKEGRRDDIIVELRAGVDPLSRLGFAAEALDQEKAASLRVPEGSLSVREILPQSPADKASLKVDDIVIAIDNIPVDGLMKAYDLLQARKDGASVSLKILKAGKEQTVDLALAEAVPTDIVRVAGDGKDGKQLLAVITDAAAGERIELPCSGIEAWRDGGEHLQRCVGTATTEFPIRMADGSEAWCSAESFAVYESGALRACRLARPYIAVDGGVITRCDAGIELNREGKVTQCVVRSD